MLRYWYVLYECPHAAPFREQVRIPALETLCPLEAAFVRRAGPALPVLCVPTSDRQRAENTAALVAALDAKSKAKPTAKPKPTAVAKRPNSFCIRIRPRTSPVGTSPEEGEGCALSQGTCAPKGNGYGDDGDGADAHGYGYGDRDCECAHGGDGHGGDGHGGDDQAETPVTALEMCGMFRCEPKIKGCVAVQITREQYARLVAEFLASRPLAYAGGVAEAQENGLVLFAEQGLVAQTVRELGLDALVAHDDAALRPLVLTAGVLSLVAWLRQTFASLSPPGLAQTRSLVYVWVGESRIGKTVAARLLVPQDAAEYHRGGINWQQYRGRPLQIYDDLTFEEETLSANLKTLFNTSDEGSIRRMYGITRIRKAAVLVLVNADTFITLKERVARNSLRDWMERNTLVYPFTNTWDVDGDTYSDKQQVYAAAAADAASTDASASAPAWRPSTYGRGLVLAPAALAPAAAPASASRDPQEASAEASADSDPAIDAAIDPVPRHEIRASICRLFSALDRRPVGEQGAFVRYVRDEWARLMLPAAGAPDAAPAPAPAPDACECECACESQAAPCELHGAPHGEGDGGDDDSFTDADLWRMLMQARAQRRPHPGECCSCCASRECPSRTCARGRKDRKDRNADCGDADAPPAKRMPSHGAAAWDASWDASWDAAWDASCEGEGDRESDLAYDASCECYDVAAWDGADAHGDGESPLQESHDAPRGSTVTLTPCP